MHERLESLFEVVGAREVIEIVLLAAAIYVVLRFLGKRRGSGMARGFLLVLGGLFLAAHLAIVAFDLTLFGKILNYLHTTVLVGLLVIFQPELRRGLMMLGRYRLMRLFTRESHPFAERLADAADALSREGVGALIAVQRRLTLDSYAETGERIDADVSATLLRTLFNPHSPLHDGAVIVQNGRIHAAACQLPLSQTPVSQHGLLGMRHRAALCLSEETDAVLLVVSEETGSISLAFDGKLEPTPRENLSRRLADVLEAA